MKTEGQGRPMLNLINEWKYFAMNITSKKNLRTCLKIILENDFLYKFLIEKKVFRELLIKILYLKTNLRCFPLFFYSIFSNN